VWYYLLSPSFRFETAPVEVREKFAVSASNQGKKSKEISDLEGVSEAVLLSTCNRMEVYLAVENVAQANDFVKHHLAGQEVGSELDQHFYTKQEDDAIRHLYSVVSGINSMVLGETEIFGQVKEAYRQALDSSATAGILNKLFQKSFSVGKKVRNSTQIQVGQTSVGSVAVDLAKRVYVTNRSYENAVSLADEVGGEAVKFDEWAKVLSTVDVVISSTGATEPVVQVEDIEAVRKKRKYRPMFFIDIAVPRDIDPRVGDIEEVYLYDLDTLQKIADEGRSNRLQQVEICKQIIDGEVEKMTVS